MKKGGMQCSHAPCYCSALTGKNKALECRRNVAAKQKRGCQNTTKKKNPASTGGVREHPSCVLLLSSHTGKELFSLTFPHALLHQQLLRAETRGGGPKCHCSCLRAVCSKDMGDDDGAWDKIVDKKKRSCTTTPRRSSAEAGTGGEIYDLNTKPAGPWYRAHWNRT